MATIGDLAGRTLDADDMRRLIEDGVLGEDGRVELVEGGLVAKALGDFAHDAVKAELGRFFLRSAPDTIHVAVASTIRLDRANLLEPDILLARKGALHPSEDGFAACAEGGILLVVEVATASLDYDRGRKAALYARFGVPEYWVIDAIGRVAWVHRGPGRAGYADITAVSPEVTLAPSTPDLAGMTVDLTLLD